MTHSVHLLLVEDDVIDQRSIQRALKEMRIANPLEIANDGVEALEILRGSAGREALPRPYLIILDISLPRMNGLELLRELRSDEELRDSIVFVLTTSRDEEDRFEAYRLNVAGYIVKGDFADGFLQIVRMLDLYWRIIEFP